MSQWKLYPLMALVILWAAPAAIAKPDFVVNSTADPGVGDCDDGTCTLREALTHVSNGDGEEIGCDAAVFPPGSGTAVNLSSPLVATVASGITLDCTGRSIIVTSEPVTIQSGAGTPLSQVTLENVAFFEQLSLCGGDRSAPPCDQPVSKVSLDRVLVEEDVEIEGASISGLTVVDSVIRGDLDARADSGDQTGITIVDSHIDDVDLEAGGDASKIKIAGNTVRYDIQADIDNELSSVVVSDNRVAEGYIELLGWDVSKTSITKNRVNTVDDSEEGINVEASNSMEKVRVESNVVSADATEGDSDDGVNVYSSGDMKNVKIAKNDVSARRADGIYVEAKGAASGVQITSNVCTGNDGYGIKLYLDGPKKTKVQGNVTNRNGISGVWVQGSLFDVSKNRAFRNLNAGIDGWNAEDSSFKKNEGLGNVDQDMSEQNGCATNTWKGNTFLTTNAGCIQ